MTQTMVPEISDPQRCLQQRLRELERHPTFAAYAQTARDIRPWTEPLRPVRIALLATFTLEPLLPYLEVEAARTGFRVSSYTAPFNVVRQELLDTDSGCHRHCPEVVFLAQLLDDVAPRLAYDYLAMSPEEVEQQVQEIVAGLAAAVSVFRQHSPAAVVVHNFPLACSPLLGIHEPSEPASQTEAIRQLNARLVETLRRTTGVYVLDFDRLLADTGYRNWQHERWYLGRAPLASEAILLVAQTYAVFLHALFASPRKCLVVDLDNTLWGGVLGEAGFSGIKLGYSYPGNAYCDVQRTILQFHRRGILLAINSKNNRTEVEEVLQHHPDMILRREHFAAIRVNWHGKADNMREIAEELEIGLDSLVYLDDHPVECDLMRRMLPEVLTLEASDDNGRPDPVRAIRLLREGGLFDKLSLTTEDRNRNELYRQQGARRRQQQLSLSLDDYLRDLQTTVSIRAVDGFSLPRIADLVQKTNQFNLTTRRRPVAQLERMIADPSWGVFALQVRDRFGDSGIVGAALVHREGGQATIDTFLLSCRVIGRRVETALLHELVHWARGCGVETLVGEFLPTAKNAPASDFYSKHGFEPVPATCEAGGSRWQLSLDQPTFDWPECIARAEEGDA